MKKKILVLTFMFICSLLFVDNVKAEVLVCKYCNNNNCYYVAHNTEAPKITDENVEFAVNEDEERQRIFNSIGKEIELKWSEGWLETDSQWTLPYIEDPTKCSKYLYYVQYKQTYGLNLYSSAEKTTDGFIETDKTVTKENSMDYIKDFLVFQFGTHDGHVNKFVVNELVYQESLPDVYIKYKTLKNNILEIMENTKDKNAKILTLNSMQSITANEVDGGDTYLKICEDNLEVLKEALK